MITKTIGIVIFSIGLILLAYTGFNYFRNEKVADLGPYEIYKEKSNSVKWPPIAGAVLLVGGTTVILLGKKIHT